MEKVVCPHCGQLNESGRIICSNCLEALRKVKGRRIIGIYYAVGGIILIAADTTMNLYFIPYVLTIIGVFSLIYGVRLFIKGKF